VLTLVLAGASRVIVAGIVIGLAAAAMLAQSISTFLYGVQPLDPVAFGSVVVVVALTAAISAFLPSCRALGTSYSFRNTATLGRDPCITDFASEHI
jgi:putative ABC transport system permease protein